MNPGANVSVQLAQAEHRIAAHRSMQAMISWAADFASGEAASGRRVMWAPCHALSGAMSLKSWIVDRAARAIGGKDSDDMPTLLSAAADVIIIVDPAAADQASLLWLTNLLACAEAAKGVVTTPPLPELVVLSQTGTGNRQADAFLESLRGLGANEVRVPGSGADAGAAALATEIKALKGKYGALLAAMAILPCPVDVEVFESLASQVRAGAGALKALTAGNLFLVMNNLVTPASREVRGEVREVLGEDALREAASLVADVLEKKVSDLPDARIEVLMLAGDNRKAVKLARKRFEDHNTAGQYEEALRVIELCRQHHVPLETGRFADEIDEAKLAAMQAAAGRHEAARARIEDLVRRRELYRTGPFIEWLALGARTLAMNSRMEPKTADSLMRRAIRLAGDDLDHSIRLTLLRVQLLESGAFGLDDRASWLLSHINNKMLDQVTEPTLAAYLEVTAGRLAVKHQYKQAFRRLRRLAPLPISDARRAKSTLLMARCRKHFADYEGSLRYAASSLHYAIRAAQPAVVTQAAKFIKETESSRPRTLPNMAPGKAVAGIRRLPALANIPMPTAPQAASLFEALSSRFGAVSWIRRRGRNLQEFGKPQPGPDTLTVFKESPDGSISVAGRSAPIDSSSRGLVILRQDGQDYVEFNAPADAEPREEGIVRLLLADRAAVDNGGEGAPPPTRGVVVDEYLRRAHANETPRGLHHTMETMFNKDVLIYLEEQGLTKEEMADRLGVSRATLYRMYARAGLN